MIIKSSRKYPEPIRDQLKLFDDGIVFFTTLAIAGWTIMKTVYAPWIGVIIAIAIAAEKVRQYRRIEKAGYQWKRLKVVCYTRLHKWNRKPTGFIAWCYDTDEDRERYHISLSRIEDAPPVGSVISICLPGNARCSEYNGTYYLSDYYGIVTECE